MAAPRAFLSFMVEDSWARDFLFQHANDRRNDIAFVDYSLHTPFDEKWKTNCRDRIAQTKGTIVLIGSKSSNSEAVKWEIAETSRQGHYLFGIQINRDKSWTIPAGLPSKNVISWDFDQIIAWLATWT
jgi:antiphage defense system Thoeris ThsB-like protein